MENASKALIMAGAILIAILIISLGLMVFNSFTKNTDPESTLEPEIISAFNSKIIPYIGESISGSQVNTLIQLARSINQKAIAEGNNTKTITITGKATLNPNDGSYKTVETGKFYKVEIKEYNNGLINKINVSEN